MDLLFIMLTISIIYYIFRRTNVIQSLTSLFKCKPKKIVKLNWMFNNFGNIKIYVDDVLKVDAIGTNYIETLEVKDGSLIKIEGEIICSTPPYDVATWIMNTDDPTFTQPTMMTYYGGNNPFQLDFKINWDYKYTFTVSYGI